MLIRTDIPLAQQIVQVGHACLEAGRQFDWPDESCNLVVLAVANRAELQHSVERLHLAGIRTACFHEPDDDLGLTAACSEALTGARRRILRRFRLWRELEHTATARGPPTPLFNLNLTMLA